MGAPFYWIIEARAHRCARTVGVSERARQGREEYSAGHAWEAPGGDSTEPGNPADLPEWQPQHDRSQLPAETGDHAGVQRDRRHRRLAHAWAATGRWQAVSLDVEAIQDSSKERVMRVEQFFLDGLGHQSYIIVDESAHLAAIVDPRRDIGIYLQAADAAEARIAYVFETHVHNDYITGAREIREHTGATIVNATSAELAYEHQGARDGDRIEVGTLAFAVLATPGHTPDHVSYALY